MPNVNIDLDGGEHDQLADIKDTHGLTWRGLLLQGAKALQNDPLSEQSDGEWVFYPTEGGSWGGLAHTGTGEAYEVEDDSTFKRVNDPNPVIDAADAIDAYDEEFGLDCDEIREMDTEELISRFNSLENDFITKESVEGYEVIEETDDRLVLRKTV